MSGDPVLVMTFAAWCAWTGTTGDADVDGHIHAGLRSAPDTKSYRRWHAWRLRTLQDERDASRSAWREAIERGLIREPTSDERLRAIAGGHEDNAATHAARRVMDKRAARLAAQEGRE